MTLSRLEPVLGELRDRLVPLVAAASGKTAGPDVRGRKFGIDGQWALSREVLGVMGFDFERGRLDPSTHPFTMQAGIDDVRVTSRMDESDLALGLLATLHEGGHALYDQGFARGDRDTLLADGASAAMHEGQARLWENHVGRSAAFASWLAPRLKRIFGSANLDAAQLFRAFNVVKPGVTRVAADELSYHLHIVLRTELEIAMIAGSLSVDDLPQAWNEKSRALLGLVPRGAKEGVLQDVHWASAMFGYFPTYSLGSLYSAQLIAAYSKRHDLDAEIRAGNFAELREWLDRTVYEKGNLLAAEEIMSEATGQGLDTTAFFAYLQAKLG